jgi:hypothetical protein
MDQVMHRADTMNAAAMAEAMFSCANIALLKDATLLVSSFVLLNLRLRALLLVLGLRVIPYPKERIPNFA